MNRLRDEPSTFAPVHPARIAVRGAEAADSRFLFDVYASTRTDVLQLDWSAEQKSAFLAMQHQAQDAHYRSHFPQAQFDIIEQDNVAVGRLYVHRSEHEIRILDIALLPRFTGQGIGTALLRALQVEADAAGKALILHVEAYNPARELYLRLGFEAVAEVGVHLRMQWPARQLNTAS